MYGIVIGIQVISIIALTAECVVVFSAWRGRLQAYLFLSCVATLVNNLGYLLELLSHSEESYFTALRLSYLGRVWIAFGLFFFVIELVGKRIPTIVRILMALINVLIYVCVFTTKETGFYYADMHFEMVGRLPGFEHEDAFGHTFFTILQAIYVLSGLFLLLSAIRKEKNRTGRIRYVLVLLAVMTEGLFTIVEMMKLFPAIERVYDITMLSFPLGVVFILIAVFRYNLLDTATLAREYVVDELSEGIIAVDDGGTVKYFNKPARLLFPSLKKNPAEVLEQLNHAIESQEPIRMEGHFYSPEKNELYLNQYSYGSVYAVIDDTEHYHYMEELKEQRAIADRANKAKSSFLASMSHEIRTPINAVLGMDEMILRETKEANTFSYARDIQNAGSTLLSLINDILDFSKIEEGKMEILSAQYDLSSVIGDLCNMIRDRMEKKNLDFQVQVDPDIPCFLCGDEVRIKQIILNLLTNAAKYTKAGSVRLMVSYAKASGEEIFLRVKVSDTGIGMKAEDLEKLFSPFTRIEETRNRSIEGTGLGMSIVKQLLALMDSHLDVKSEYGKGSEFAFEIRQKVMKADPVGDFAARVRVQKKQSGNYRELFHAPEARILVVDDMEVNLVVMKNLLKQTRIQIDTAYSGPEAIALAKETAYDAMFIDHMMPEMDGIETLQHLKEESMTLPPCIALTANAVSGARETYLRAGFSDYLSKPVSGIRLEEMLLRILPPEKIETPVEEHTEGSSLPDWLLAIPEIDIAEGVQNCGSEEDYMTVLVVFHESTSEKMEEIETFQTEGDIENYTIRVHGLKSSARTIGAMALSDLARELEEAGKAGDRAAIDEKTPELLRQYEALDRKLQRIEEESAV